MCWDDGKREVALLELTIPFYTLLEEAALRKKVNAELVESIKRAGYMCTLIMMEFGSYDLINLLGFSKLKNIIFPKKTMKEQANV